MPNCWKKPCQTVIKVDPKQLLKLAKLYYSLCYWKWATGHFDSAWMTWLHLKPKLNKLLLTGSEVGTLCRFAPTPLSCAGLERGALLVLNISAPYNGLLHHLFIVYVSETCLQWVPGGWMTGLLLNNLEQPSPALPQHYLTTYNKALAETSCAEVDLKYAFLTVHQIIAPILTYYCHAHLSSLP